jgi:hypothetical protein
MTVSKTAGGVFGIIKWHTMKRMIKNHWELVQNSLGHSFWMRSGWNYRIRQVGVMKPTRILGGHCRYPRLGNILVPQSHRIWRHQNVYHHLIMKKSLCHSENFSRDIWSNCLVEPEKLYTVPCRGYVNQESEEARIYTYREGRSSTLSPQAHRPFMGHFEQK